LKKQDMLLYGSIIVLSIVGIFIMLSIGGNASYISVTIDGVYKGRYALSQDREVVIEDGKGGTNTLVIEDGKAYVSQANCPGQDCVEQGSISLNNQSIICLPHRLAIIITNPKDEEIDGETD